ncbi:MAG: helix-turn-helix domain-containing protein [Atribacterota bacterium]
MNKMKLARLLLGMSLDDLFLKTKIPQSRLSRIEREIILPKDEEKKLISKELNLNIEELFEKVRINFKG